jgi:TetR/AcrR family transcriptional regulator
MSEKKEKPTEETILEAAMKVFTKRGFAAARTEEIAKEAGINRALLHYYYRDKETIFKLIFETRFKEFFSGVFTIFKSEGELFQKIQKLIDHEIDTFSRHPDLARFIIGEIGQHPERLVEYGKKMNINPIEFIKLFEEQVRYEAGLGNIKPIEGRQLIMNIMSLCIYPFVARPIIKTMLQLDDLSFNSMMEQRKKEIFEFIINAIKK